MLTTVIRFHSLFANQRYAGPGVVLERYADTTGWRLDLPDLFAGMDGKHRTSCRKARKEGVTVRIQPGPPDLGGFVALYEETMRRLGVGGFYLFPQSYWDSLTGPLRERVVLGGRAGRRESSPPRCSSPRRRGSTTTSRPASERGRALGAVNLVLSQTAEWDGRRATSASTWAAAPAARRIAGRPSSGASIRAGTWSGGSARPSTTRRRTAS